MTQIIPALVWGLLGSLFLLFLHRLVAQFFPRPPAEVFHSAARAQRPPTEEEGDGMATVYSLDSTLMEAEFERPGSTFWMYYRQSMAVFARWIGSLLVSFSVVSWILGTGKTSSGSILAFLLGLALSGYTYQTWWMSRPRLKERQ